MKKLPKRNGYVPKPLPRDPTLEEVLKRTAWREIVRLAQESGVDVQGFLRHREYYANKRERKDQAVLAVTYFRAED